MKTRIGNLKIIPVILHLSLKPAEKCLIYLKWFFTMNTFVLELHQAKGADFEL